MKKIHISGVIGWDVMPAQIRDALNDAAGEDVEILVSSPGGYVSDGIEIFNLIKNYPGHTTAVLSGFAMSMGSYIPLAAKTIRAEDNAVYMIHNVQGGVWGDHNDILKYGNYTQALSKMLAGAYVNFTGKSLEEVCEMMDRETFFYGSEIVAHGFAHEMVETGSDDNETALLAVAKTALQACTAKIAGDAVAVKSDLAKAASYVAGQFEKHRATRPTHKQIKEETMDLKTLKEKHQDLVALIVDEATGAQDVKMQEAQKAGAVAERDRINDVRSQLIPGHEQLIETLAFDGESTGADAAKAIVAAEKALRVQAQAIITDDANEPVRAVADHETKKPIKRAEFNKFAPGEQRAFFATGGLVED